MSGLMYIQKVILPFSLIEYVYNHLRSAGENEVECVALLIGVISDSVFEIKNSIIPAQTGYKVERGLLYSVEGEELYRINKWLYEHKMTLMAQVHSHPGEAYHSETDDRYPIVAVVGGLSIVIPDFGFRHISISDWAVYRLMPSQGWLQLSEKEINNLIQIQY